MIRQIGSNYNFTSVRAQNFGYNQSFKLPKNTDVIKQNVVDEFEVKENTSEKMSKTKKTLLIAGLITVAAATIYFTKGKILNGINKIITKYKLPKSTDEFINMIKDPKIQQKAKDKLAKSLAKKILNYKQKFEKWKNSKLGKQPKNIILRLFNSFLNFGKEIKPKANI